MIEEIKESIPKWEDIFCFLRNVNDDYSQILIFSLGFISAVTSFAGYRFKNKAVLDLKLEDHILTVTNVGNRTADGVKIYQGKRSQKSSHSLGSIPSNGAGKIKLNTWFTGPSTYQAFYRKDKWSLFRTKTVIDVSKESEITNFLYNKKTKRRRTATREFRNAIKSISNTNWHRTSVELLLFEDSFGTDISVWSGSKKDPIQSYFIENWSPSRVDFELQRLFNKNNRKTISADVQYSRWVVSQRGLHNASYQTFKDSITFQISKRHSRSDLPIPDFDEIFSALQKYQKDRGRELSFPRLQISGQSSKNGVTNSITLGIPNIIEISNRFVVRFDEGYVLVDSIYDLINLDNLDRKNLTVISSIDGRFIIKDHRHPFDSGCISDLDDFLWILERAITKRVNAKKLIFVV